MICLTIWWAVSVVWMLWAIGVSILWASPYYDLCMFPFCECPQDVKCVRLQAINMLFEDVGLRMSPGCELWASRYCDLYHVSNSRLGSVCLQGVHFQTVTMKLELSASHVCSICNISRQLQFSVSGWPIPISWIYLIIRFGYIPTFDRRMPDLQLLYY